MVHRPWSIVQKQKPPVHNGTGGRFPWYHPNFLQASVEDAALDTLRRLTSASRITSRLRFALLVGREAILHYVFTRTAREGTSTGFRRMRLTARLAATSLWRLPPVYFPLSLHVLGSPVTLYYLRKARRVKGLRLARPYPILEAQSDFGSSRRFAWLWGYQNR